MKHLTPDVILRNLIKISHYLLGVPLTSIRRWKKADLENTDFENVVYVLIEKP